MLPEFKYYRPRTLNEAMEIMHKYSAGKAIYVAGGTDVLVSMRNKPEMSHPILISLKATGKSGINFESNKLTISAFTTLREIENSDLIKERCTALHDAASQIGSVQIRNVATIGGNLCSALPCADTAAPLIVMQSRAVIIGLSTQRTIPLNEFFIGPGENVLEKEEILHSIEIPLGHSQVSSAYIKHGRRRAMEIAIAGVAISIILDDAKEKCEEARVALTTCAPIPLRCENSELVLRGLIPSCDNIKRLGLEVLKEAMPRDSFRSTAAYRSSILPILVKRAIEKAMERGGILCE